MAPSSHGNHRILSLIGFGAKERGWKILKYSKEIAGSLFNIFIDEIKSHNWKEQERHPPSMFGILMEILASFESQKATDAIIAELDGMIKNFKKNVSDSYKLSKKSYMISLPK